jgi:hypothetical protein
MRLTIAVAAIITAALPLGASSAASRHEDRTIDLPSGFEGEGVTVGRGKTFYAGSLADGRIARGDLRRRTSEVWVDAPVVAPAVGLKADVRHRLLWVAGGPTGRAAVYDLRTADAVADLTLTSGPETFINDVAVTRRAAYFTNSLTPELYRVPASSCSEIGEPETIQLVGPASEFEPGFNLNGIAATPDGRTLIVVNSVKGELYTVDAATGDSAEIDLGDGSVHTGDGLVLSGRRTLYVLQNGTQPGVPNQIAVIRLARDLSSGRIVDTLTSPLFETATTLAKRGNLLAAVNAQFAGAPIDPEAEIVLLRAR